MSRVSGLEPLRAHWARLPGREKNLFRLAALVTLAWVLWQFSLAPGLALLRTADAQAQALEAQMQQMQAMQMQVQAIEKQPVLGFDEAVRALSTATKQTLGATAQLAMAGDRASVTLKDASPEALAQWLVQARVNARSHLVEARLVRGTAAAGPVWSGMLVMGLPAR